MRRPLAVLLALTVAAAVGGVAAQDTLVAGAGVRAGVAKIDSTWHVGASAGQYASDGFAVGDHGVDPTTHSTRRSPSYGLQSREWVRALVVEGTDGTRWALVSNDLYIPQDLLNRRVAGILEEHDTKIALGLIDGEPTGITDDNMTISVSHSHSSPYYSTPSWGVWAFQDVFDIRFFEHVAQKMAQAVIEASAGLVPVRMGATVVPFGATRRHSFGPTVADDGTPAGYLHAHGDKTASVVRFDDITDPEAPSPLATWVIYGLHPEMLDGNDLLTGEYVNTMYRFVDRQIGGVTLFSQNDTGTAEPARDAQAHPASARAEFSHREYAQMERAARLLADAVIAGHTGIATGAPPDPERTVAFSDDFTVGVSDMRFAPPSYRLFPTVSSCRTEKAFDGNPGVPIVGLPDCAFPLGQTAKPVFDALGLDPGVTYDTLRQAGVPVPDNTSAPSYTGLEETLQVHLQAIRLGAVAVTICPCEQWADQSLNIRSRLDRVAGNFYDGFDYTELSTPASHGARPSRPWCEQTGATWICADPRNPTVDLAPVSDLNYQRMRAQIHNDAAGWEDIDNTLHAEYDPANPQDIKGNYTHEELTPFGYDLVLTVGMSNDYWGYIATYREYQRGDHYRKALTGLGPHSSDFLATRLTRMAASLNGGPAVELSAKDLAYSPEDIHEYQRAQVIGRAASALLPAYEALLPDDGGTPAITVEPTGIERFGIATVGWTGGSNYTDTPDVRVERLVGESWTPFGDGSGEVQYRVHYPQPDELLAYRTGQFEWRWEATFEAFDSDIELPDATGVVRRQTPSGTYRFVIDGSRRAGGAVEAYSLTSDPFEVAPWSGITVDQIGVLPDGEVWFTLGPVNTYTYGTPNNYVVGPIDYPDSYAGSPFPFIDPNDRQVRTYGSGIADDEQFCFECSFRPWIDTGRVERALVTFVDANDVRTTVPATFDGTIWVTSATLTPGGYAYVAPGDIVDGFGEINGEISDVVPYP